jgi:hypothetical protein
MARAKGTVLVGLVKGLRRQAERARQVLPPHLLHYLEERIVLAAWYPLEDYLAMLRLLTKVLPDAPADFYVQIGRSSAKEQMSGVYGRLSQDTSRKAVATLLAAMFDTGEMTVVEREAGRAVTDWVGFAEPCRELCAIFTGYQMERMTRQGFDDVHARHTRCRAEGGSVCRWELTWKSRPQE